MRGRQRGLVYRDVAGRDEVTFLHDAGLSPYKHLHRGYTLLASTFLAWE